MYTSSSRRDAEITGVSFARLPISQQSLSMAFQILDRDEDGRISRWALIPIGAIETSRLLSTFPVGAALDCLLVRYEVCTHGLLTPMATVLCVSR